MKKTWILAVLILIFCLSVPETASASDWKHYQRGIELLNKGRTHDAIKELERAAAISAKASTLRKLAESYEKINQHQKAASTYYREANTHKARGDLNTYLAVKRIADGLNTEITLSVSQQGVRTQGTLAKYEPQTGVYVGAYIEQDGLAVKENKYESFNQLTGKNHAVYFNYHNYGTPFPYTFAGQVKKTNGAIQIAMEPNQGLASVRDDMYLRQFAKDAKASGVPIFLRFASEMNGSWVKWHGNPSLYKEKFQLVAKVMKEEAPNVAMVWSPNSTPEQLIDQYYPGDRAVDWVGVNMYSVPYFNGISSQPAETINPLDLLDKIYNTYASRKPIMIAEYGASHFTSVGNQNKTLFGKTKMGMFYQGLRINYPRVKAVHWFSVDTLTAIYVPENRRFNNFSLSANQTILNTYKGIVSTPYYLSAVVNGPFAAQEKASGPIVDNLKGMKVRQNVSGLGFVKTHDPYIKKVVYLLNGSYLSESDFYPYDFTLQYNHLKAGANKLEAVVFDSKGMEAARSVTTFEKGSPLGQINANQLSLFLGDEQAYTSTSVIRLLSAPYSKNGYTQVPLRFISENLGATVQWNQATKAITITKGKTTIQLTTNSSHVTVNGVKKKMAQTPTVKNGATFVPLRFVSEELGLDVKYTSGSYRIDIKE